MTCAHQWKTHFLSRCSTEAQSYNLSYRHHQSVSSVKRVAVTLPRVVPYSGGSGDGAAPLHTENDENFGRVFNRVHLTRWSRNLIERSVWQVELDLRLNTRRERRSMRLAYIVHDPRIGVGVGTGERDTCGKKSGAITSDFNLHTTVAK